MYLLLHNAAQAMSALGSLADLLPNTSLMSVYGLLLFASNLYLADMARLHTYIRPLKLAYVY